MSANAIRDANLNQLRASDPENSVFVTANAGSGKTKVLVDRIARLLLEGSAPSAFLCITYTKAAAAEMQRRLFERLGAWCVMADDTLAEELAKLGAPNADLTRARALFAQALETPGGLKIQTIHAFCERLLARFPLEAGVAPGFDIADEARSGELLGRARAEAALAEDAPAEAFRRFAARLHGEALEDLLDRLALRRADFHRYAALNQGLIFAEAAIRSRHGARQSVDAFCRAFLARQDWRALAAAAKSLEGSSKNDQAAAERLRLVLANMERNALARDVLQACFDFALTTSGEPYKKLLTKKFTDTSAADAAATLTFADACIEARRELNAIERAEDAVAALALALKLDAAYADAKSRAGVLDFDDLIEHAQTLLQRSEAAPWVLYKLDGGLDHILIDEGQDTSPAQWDLIAPLQDEFFAGAGARARRRTVFAVGDPKQSIYAFQGADPRRFLSEAQALSKRAAKAKQAFVAPALRTSFRSAPEILAAVDATFAALPLIDAAPERHDEIKHLAARDEPGVVEVWPTMPRPEAAPARAWDAPVDVETGVSVHALLARRVAQHVSAMIGAKEAVWERGSDGLARARPMRAGDVLALVRTRGALFRELIKAFKRAGLPVAGADRMVLNEELAVEDCLALMRVALDPHDDLALACVLKGPWCNLDDDDAHLFPLAYGRGRRETLFARLMASADDVFAPARAFVAALTARGSDDPFAFLSWALETPHQGGATGWERVFARLGPEARDPLEELLQRALKPPVARAATLQRFLHDIEIDAGQVKRELEAESGAVRVMTVHGAKGLEAPVVILPDTTAPPGDKPDAGLIFDDEAGPFVSFRAKDDDAPAAAARAAHAARALNEHRRLLYVAMTRARDRLIVCGAQYKNGEAQESWRPAVENALIELGATRCETPCGEGWRLGSPARTDAADESVCEEATLPLPAWAKAPVLLAQRIDVAAPSRAKRIDPALFSPRGDGAGRFRRGHLIHGLLQRLPELAAERREEAARAWLMRQGASEAEAESFAREALAVIGDQRFAAVFGPGSRAEAPIIGFAAGKAVSGIVDRLAVDVERVLVLDFKTDRPAPTDVAEAPEPYVLQLALYREVLRTIFPRKSVACALLWTERPHLMELPDSRLDEAFEAFRHG
ncbi:MAG: double-strand break repair helicase AddA [Hyphomonadaceae bacterium]